MSSPQRFNELSEEDPEGIFCLYSDFSQREKDLLKKVRDLFRENQELKDDMRNILKELNDTDCGDLTGFNL